ncbi:hypothetical protein [Mycobacterium phage MKC-IRE-02]|uniref:Uncharacterized protein n=3 Tax=Cheoctovirus TaxID=1623281 RepID=A0A3G8FKA5_9CAUD|nr:hypothetical protein I5H29_gp87 [Mycobacterium phage Doug]YP_009957601.1 hypothetical protein I5H42_gp089 [Mycobacterium phage Gandalph]YP_009963587.1 hypothetical protein I5I00_gp090 [Mycobacterium phage Zerg]WNM68465.1 hypothetical protein SEA_STARCEVICH_90 [Mycobacterium phage Starcevich]AZF95156.1 hypothetical protein ZERG_90 [Mycobacterium phage Zerg]QFG04813.1 hypothetical protein SEA_DOUG_87 [Mycobacterium phage Doug]QNN98033.1 hypothetical protein SEA_GANDALPH_89 [Mycobacterium pha
MSEVFVRPTRYEVTAWPGPVDGVNRSQFVLYVEWRGEDRWCVTDGSYCYRRDGHKSYERNPSSRTDRFKKAYRFSLDEALEIAKRVAPTIRVGRGPNREGLSAADMWEWEKNQ